MEVDDQRRLRTVHADDRVRKCRGHLILRLHNLDGRARCGGAVDDDAVRKVVFDHEVGEGLPRGHIEGDRVLVRETRPGRRFPFRKVRDLLDGKERRVDGTVRRGADDGRICGRVVELVAAERKAADGREGQRDVDVGEV